MEKRAGGVSSSFPDAILGLWWDSPYKFIMETIPRLKNGKILEIFAEILWKNLKIYPKYFQIVKKSPKIYPAQRAMQGYYKE